MSYIPITQEEFALRRHRLMAQLEPGSLAIIPSATERLRNSDVEYPFRQDSTFFYFTGFHEPDALAVLVPGRPDGEFVLFCRERDREMEIWNGYRMGPEGVQAHLGVDEAHSNEELDELLPALLDGCRQVYLPMGHDSGFEAQVMAWIDAVRAQARRGAKAPETLMNLNPITNEMRLYKSDAEAALMRRSGVVAAEAHKRAMRVAHRATHEYQLEAEINHEFAWHGARLPAYSAIVGGGANACVLHYTENNAPLQSGDLVLIDAGCELDYYAADITRTFPVSGRFSAEQRTLYELVLRAHEAALAQVKPGNHFNQPHETVLQVLTEGLVELGLLQGEVAELISSEAYKDFFMHRTSHWLGMDVHDVGRYKTDDGAWREFEPGMCLTIEPGLYIAPDNGNVDERWRGIGIRIEDDVMVTVDGHENFSLGVPKDPDEIERLMQDV